MKKFYGGHIQHTLIVNFIRSRITFTLKEPLKCQFEISFNTFLCFVSDKFVAYNYGIGQLAYWFLLKAHKAIIKKCIQNQIIILLN